MSSGAPLAAALVLEPFLQLVEGFDEFRDALALELLRDSLEIDVESLEALAHVARLGEMTLERELGAAESPVGVDRLERHGVDGPGHHQLLDVLDGTVGRVLGRSGGPEQPLRTRTAVGEHLPRGLGSGLLEDLVRATGAGD